jgi:HK97 gp10 family phage protein
MTIKVEVKGLPELKRELERLSDAAQGRLTRNAAMAAARIAAKAARQNAPVSPGGGALKRSIKAKWGAPDKPSTTKEALVNSLFYGRFIELGTPFIAQKPFMRPAIDESKGEMIAKMASNLQTGIERELKRQAVVEDEGET